MGIRNWKVGSSRRSEGADVGRSVLRPYGKFGDWLGVPGDAGQVALAVFPLDAGKDTRRDLDEARRQFEDGEWCPGLASASVKTTLVQGVGHPRVRQVLNDHLGKAIQYLDLGRILLQVKAVAGDACTVRNLLTDAGIRRRAARAGFRFALPFNCREAPTGLFFLLEVFGTWPS